MIATARFCGACGNPVAAGRNERATADPPARQEAGPPSTDPFAKTVLGDAAGVAALLPKPNATATAGSVSTGARRPTTPVAAAEPARKAPVSPMASSVMDGPSRYTAGAVVLVQWSNGNRYPGTVLQVSGTQALVAFPDGQKHWVDVKYLSKG